MLRNPMFPSSKTLSQIRILRSMLAMNGTERPQRQIHSLEEKVTAKDRIIRDQNHFLKKLCLCKQTLKL